MSIVLVGKHAGNWRNKPGLPLHTFSEESEFLGAFETAPRAGPAEVMCKFNVKTHMIQKVRGGAVVFVHMNR